MKPAVVQQQLAKVLLGYVDAALVPQQGPASEMQVGVASKHDCTPSPHEAPLMCRALTTGASPSLAGPVADSDAAGPVNCCIPCPGGRFARGCIGGAGLLPLQAASLMMSVICQESA